MRNNRVRITLKQTTELNAPKKRVTEELLKVSKSQEFDDATKEFIVESIIFKDDESFSEHCQLCNTAGLKFNFILYNPETDKRLSVGSTCILRFNIGQGVYDVDSGMKMLQNMADEKYLVDAIQTNVTGVLVPVPDKSDLNKFVKYLKEYMGVRGINNPTIDQLKQIFFGPKWEEVDDPIVIDRMKTIWEKPAFIPTTINSIPKRLPSNPKEGTTWHKRRRSVSFHGGTSEVYHVEDYVANKITR